MLINYEKLKKYRYRKSPSTHHYCCKCAGGLEYCHLEEDLYCVRCEDCETYTLVE